MPDSLLGASLRNTFGNEAFGCQAWLFLKSHEPNIKDFNIFWGPVGAQLTPRQRFKYYVEIVFPKFKKALPVSDIDSHLPQQSLADFLKTPSHS